MENFIIAGTNKSFHGASVYLEKSAGGEEIAEGDVGLTRGPFEGDLTSRTLDDVVDEESFKAIEGRNIDTPSDGDLIEVVIDIRFGIFFTGSDDQKVGAVGGLRLAEGRSHQLSANRGVRDDKKPVRLESVTCGSEDERLFKGLPMERVDFFVGIKLFGGVSPAELAEQSGGGNRLE